MHKKAPLPVTVRGLCGPEITSDSNNHTLRDLVDCLHDNVHTGSGWKLAHSYGGQRRALDQRDNRSAVLHGGYFALPVTCTLGIPFGAVLVLVSA
mgnify:CR=1 FL=1